MEKHHYQSIGTGKIKKTDIFAFSATMASTFNTKVFNATWPISMIDDDIVLEKWS